MECLTNTLKLLSIRSTIIGTIYVEFSDIGISEAIIHQTEGRDTQDDVLLAITFATI